MRKMVVLNFETGRASTLYGTEDDFRRALRQAHPEVRQFHTLGEMVDYLNQDGWLEIHIKDVEDDNLLPEGYWYKTQKDYDEPWVRESHFHDEESDPDTDPGHVRLDLDSA